MKSYAALAFTDSVKELQERFGSRSAYARQERHSDQGSLTEHEIAFIGEQDSFYLATLGKNGFPYIQHRGGPKGFLKVIDEDTLGFVDFTGNRQYISAGNILTHPEVSLIMMDYPRRARLKLYATARIVELSDQPDLFHVLDPADYPHRPERMMVLTVQAYDWNCPQHITPRYTAGQVNELLQTQQVRIRQLEQQVKTLQEEVASRPV